MANTPPLLSSGGTIAGPHTEPTEEERGDSHTVLDNLHYQLISWDTTVSQGCDHHTSKNRGLQVLCLED